MRPQENSSYRLLVCDLDGTLMDHGTTISQRVRQTVNAVRRQGIQFSLATGRGFPETLPFARVLDISIPIICYQGGLVRHPLTGETFYQATMARELALEVVQLAHARDWQMLVYIDDDVFLEGFRHKPSFYRKMLGLNIKCVRDLAKAIGEHSSDPAKLLFIGEESDADDIQSELNARFAQQVQIVRSHLLFVEGNPRGVNKGDALRRLAQHLEICQSQVIAIGDQGNDVPMLEWAGLGIAMGNGSEVTREAADWVAPPFSEQGAIVAMERFLLG